MGNLDRTDLRQDRNRWWAPVNAVMKLRVNIQCGEYVDYLRRVSSSGRSCCMQLVTYKNASATERKTCALNSRWMKASYAIHPPWLFSETLQKRDSVQAVSVFVFLTSSQLMY